MKPFFVIIGRPRTGSSYLTELCKKSEVFDSRGELFNKTTSYNLTGVELAKMFSPLVLAKGKEEIASKVRENPVQVLDTLTERAHKDGKTLVFKLFKGHLEPEALRQLFSLPEAHFMLLDRQILPSFVSYIKAIELNKWDRVDTSNVTVKFNGDMFNRWFRNQIAWYQEVLSLLAEFNKSSQYNSYEDLLSQPPEECFTKIASAAEFSGLKLAPKKVTKWEMSHKKQDKKSDFSSTVSNYEFMMGAPGIYATRGGTKSFYTLINENK